MRETAIIRRKLRTHRIESERERVERNRSIARAFLSPHVMTGSSTEGRSLTFKELQAGFALLFVSAFISRFSNTYIEQNTHMHKLSIGVASIHRSFTVSLRNLSVHILLLLASFSFSVHFSIFTFVHNSCFEVVVVESWY